MDGFFATQTQIVSTLVPAEDFFTNTNIVASSVPPREAVTAYAYGDYREFLAVSTSIMDSAVLFSAFLIRAVYYFYCVETATFRVRNPCGR